MIRRLAALGLLLLAPGALAAQAPAHQHAAETITAADVARRIGILADDSMEGRNTPSPGLDRAARYIASEFRRLGLRPGGDSGGWFHRYAIAQRRMVPERSVARLTQVSGERGVSTTFAEGAAWIAGGTGATAKGSVVLVGGRLRTDSLPAAAVRDRMVVWVLPAGVGAAAPAGFTLDLARLRRAGARGLIVVTGSDSLFTRYRRVQLRTVQTVGDEAPGAPILLVREGAVLAQLPEGAEQFAALRAAPGSVIQPMLDWEAEVTIADTTLSYARAPNVVGILEGSDPVLRNEYLVYSAHMDGLGRAGQPGSECGASGGDDICNGADDDASGTAAVLELAEAFSRPGARPRRSIIFLTVSGEEHGLWGSAQFAENPPVPLSQLVANINIDMIGRNWPDTIVAIGKEHSDLGQTLNRVNARHPELGMTAIDDRWPEQRFYERSDHYNFARKGVPILFFFNGVHPDYHRPSDSAEKINAEKEARIVRLLFHLGLAVGNAAERPKWTPESYRAIVTP